VAWAREVERRGAGEILLTSMDGDGTKEGYDVGLTRAISDAVSIPVIASGGAGRPEHFVQALTEGRRGGCAGGQPLPLPRTEHHAGQGGRSDWPGLSHRRHLLFLSKRREIILCRQLIHCLL
jgi:hypothetical protein